MLAWLLVAALAFAEPPAIIGWDALAEHTRVAFSAREGAAYDARDAALRDAWNHEPLTEATFEVQLAPTSRAGLATWDDNNMARVGFTLGDRRGARRAWWAAQSHLLESEADVAALRYAEDVRVAWLDAWVSASMARHLREHVDALQQRRDTLVQAVTSGIVTRDTLDGLDAEVGRMRAEASDYAQQTAAHGVTLARLLGEVITPDLDAPPSTPSDENPWQVAAIHVDASPHVRAAASARDVHRADARVARRSAPPTLTIGALWRPTPIASGGTSSGAPGGVVALTVPLTNLGASDARAASGQAAAADVQYRAQRDALRAAFIAEANALDHARRRVPMLFAEVEAPLEARVERLRAALERGATTFESLVLAERDLHEAFHDRARATADLLLREARGATLRDALRESR